MSRRRKGRTADKHWYTTIGYQTVKVADKSCSYDEAFRKYAELIADRGEAPPNELIVKNLFRRFLKWAETNRSPATFKFYERYLHAFAKHHGNKRLGNLLPRHVERWVETEYTDCSPSTRHGIMKSIARAINWGIQKRYLKHNPLIGMEKPSRAPRELVINQEQFTELLTHVPDVEFQDYLLFLWNTGCRAMEARVVEKRHFDGATITLPASEAKGKRYPRVIYLNEVALGIVQRLVTKYPTGPLFRRPDSKPWTANAVRLRFRRKTPAGQLFRKHKLTDAQLSRNRLALGGLNHSHAEEDIRPILCERGDGLEDVHACAISLAESFDLTGLSKEIADLVLDNAVTMETRVDAGHALRRVGSADAKERLLPLIAGSEDDSNDDLKGIALHCNWPDRIDTATLLKSLSPSSLRIYYGAYHSFLLQLRKEGFISRNNLVAGLKWATSVFTQVEDGEELHYIAQQVALTATEELNDPQVRKAFINFAMTADAIRHRIFYLHRADDLKKKHDDFEARLARDEALRRLLLSDFARRKEDSFTVWQVARSIPGLMQLEDFKWLLQRATDGRRRMDSRTHYAHLAQWLPWGNDVASLELWLAVHDKEPIASVFSLPSSVELNSEQAQRIRENYEDAQSRKVCREPTLIEPPPVERVQNRLELAQNYPRWFGQLSRELTITEESTHYGFERFLTRSPGWEAADEATRSRIISAARHLLKECPDLARKCGHSDFTTILGDGAMVAIFLLMELEESWIDSLDSEWWDTWSWYILRELHMHMHGEPDEPKRSLLLLLHESAPVAIRRHLVRLAKAKDGSNLLKDLLEEGLSAVSDNYIKRISTALEDDFNTQFYYPTFRMVRKAGRYRDVTFGQIETTSILANNRELGKVSPQATMEFDLPKRDILVTEALKRAKAAVDEYGALLNDPTFLSLAKMGSGMPTSSQLGGTSVGYSAVRNVLPGLDSSTQEQILSQSGPGDTQIGSAFESLIPDPAIYKFETGTGYEIRPVVQPDGQAVVFDFNYMYTTRVREPVRADEKHLGRVKRHYIDTDVQLSNYELREISRYQV